MVGSASGAGPSLAVPVRDPYLRLPPVPVVRNRYGTSSTLKVDSGRSGQVTGSVASLVARYTAFMRVIVDFDQCESNALCMAAAPEVFEVRDDDFLYVLQDEPPEELRAKVEAAARSCPKTAITIED